MAERTGSPDIDAAVLAFLDADFVHDQGSDRERLLPVRSLVRPRIARGQCGVVADAFADFLKERGVDAWAADQGRRGWWDGEPGFGDRPDDFGYQDRPVSGASRHTLTVVSHEGEVFAVDFTAAQYGYREFPLVQRLGEDGWERDFEMERAPKTAQAAKVAA